MNLHIKDITCPRCGAMAVRDELRESHNTTIKEYDERRVFKCGYQAVWDAETKTLGVMVRCQNTPEMAAKREKRIAAGEEMVKLLKGLDVDDDFKEQLSMKLRNQIRHMIM